MWFVCNREVDTLERAVQEALNKRRREHARDLSTAVRGIFLLMLIRIILIRFLAGSQRKHTGVQDALLLAFYGQSLLSHVCPCMLSMNNMDLWYSCSMVALTAYHAPLFCTREFMPLANTYTLVLGSIISLGNLRWQLVTFWNVISVACTWAALRVSEVDGDLASMMIQSRLILTLWLSFYAWLIATRWRQQALREIEAQLLKENHSAGNTLMTMFYDQVTELDANLTVAASGRELASFLHCDVGRSLEGMKFVELLHIEEEKELFLARAQQPVREQETLADVLHMTMFLTSRPRQVELFTFQFPSIIGGRRFLVGIRDGGEEQLQQPLQLPGLPSSVDTASSRIGPCPQSGTVTVNTELSGLPITCYSPAFGQMVGLTNPVANLLLAAFVVDINEVERWIQNVMNMRLLDYPEEEVRRANCCRVALQPCNDIEAPTSYRCMMQCMIIFADGDEEDSEVQDDVMSVQLQFSCWRRTGSSRRRAARARASPSCNHSSSGSSSASHGTPSVVERRSLGRVVMGI